MKTKALESMLTVGETVAVEFKRCGNGIEHDKETESKWSFESYRF